MTTGPATTPETTQAPSPAAVSMVSASSTAPPASVTPPTEAGRLSRAQEMLLEYLRDHDASCPVCTYSLRGLTRPICPECRHELQLTVGAARLPLAWLFVSVAPGFFSGIAACFVAVPVTGVFYETGEIVWPPFTGVLFGWTSGAIAILLARRHRSFIALPIARQRWIALGIWLAHVAALIGFIAWLVWYV